MPTRTGDVFETIPLHLAGTTEQVVVGGRDKFPLLPAALAGVKTIGVIGWGSQGPAQAQNLRDALEGSGIVVKVGLRAGSSSFAKAAASGFDRKDGTAGDMDGIIAAADLVLLLTADAAQAEGFRAIQARMKPGSTLGLSHGFLVGHMKNERAEFRHDINVVGVCPKGMGPSVRRLFEQGKEVNGAGINSSYAIQQDYTGTARNIALGWAVAIGSPYVFETTLEMEYRSDIFGERGVLLGAVWGILEALFSNFMLDGNATRGDAFARSALSLTGPISKAISDGGLLGVAKSLAGEQDDAFYRNLYATYAAAKPILIEIYNEVASGREIGSVIDATNRLTTYPMSKVDGAVMWRTGETARQGNLEVAIEPATAGIYLGIMMAQIDVLQQNGHGWSEICNETIIEAVDSLNPYMAARGVDYMIDNCSTTARLGARKWGPRFAQMVSGDVVPHTTGTEPPGDFRQWFLDHPVHRALGECMKLRPPVNISVQ
jgi:ketol-acid reductoisomerase